MQVIEKKNFKNYCKTIFEENGFHLSKGSKVKFEKDFGEFIIYTILHMNIEIVIEYENKNKSDDYLFKNFHLNGNYGAVELIFKNLDRIIERFKTSNGDVENYFFLIFLQEENHAIFTRYFFKRNNKIHTQDYFSTKVGFVDLEPKEEDDFEYDQNDNVVSMNIHSSNVDSTGD